MYSSVCNGFLAVGVVYFNKSSYKCLNSAKSFTSKTLALEFLFLGIRTIGTSFPLYRSRSIIFFLRCHIAGERRLLESKLHWPNLIKTNPRGCVTSTLGYLQCAPCMIRHLPRSRCMSFPDVRAEVLSLPFTKGHTRI